MKSINHFLRSAATLIVALAAVLAPAGVALADKLHLKNGEVLEGRIEREGDGYVWFVTVVGKIENKQFFVADEILKIERDEAAPADAAATPAKADKASSARTGSATRVAILNFGPPGDWPSKGLNAGNTVGIHICAQAFKDAIPLLEADDVDVVVIRINSGGGMLLEMPRLNDLFHNEYKKRFRTVAWVESAISAAAMSPYCLEEIYFMSQGNLGACTAFFGASLVAMKDVELEQLLRQMVKYSQRGQRDPKIMRSMQIQEPLSCTIDENGDVHWFQDLTGEYTVNPEGRVLTLNSRDALRYKFSKGTADTKEELADALGLQEVEWVGERAAKVVDDFMLTSTESERRFGEYYNKYLMALQEANGTQERQQRGAAVNRARRYLNEIRQQCKKNENFKLINGTDDDWFEEQERILDRLMR